MRTKLLIFGFFLSIILISLVGFYALNAGRDILIPFQKSEAHFQAIATAATEVTSYAKRAEGHLMLYLALHRDADKKKFPKRVASLYEQISMLDQNIKDPDGRAIFDTIRKDADTVLPVGNALIAAHDKAVAETGRFEMEKHRETIFNLHEIFAKIRQSGVDLASFEIKMENDLRLEVIRNAEQLQLYLRILIIFTALFALYLAVVMIDMISKLNKEITVRKKSEEILQSEQAKLHNALSRVKTLSGLLPICSSCKKIRDDKGYWNQIENYIKKHSDADFSHGLCPDCIKKLYPDVIDDDRNS